MKLSIRKKQTQHTNWIWVVIVLLLFASKSYGTTYTSNVVTGNWSIATTWSPNGVPGSGDNVIIHGGDVITVDSVFTCTNLTIGDATSGNTTLQITTGGDSLTINGALSINPSSINKIYLLNAGPGSINIAGTIPTWCTTTGTNTIEVSTGTLSFTPAVTVSANSQNIVFLGAGTINFNSSYTDQYNRLVTFAGCTVNFGGTYTVNTTTANWAGKGTAVFATNKCGITATSNLILYNVQLSASSALVLNSAAGTVDIAGALTLGSGSSFIANENFELDGNWTNNGGTFTGGGNTITMNGVTTVTGATTFAYMQMGNLTTTVTVTLTISANVICSGITYTGYNRARTISVTTGDTLTVNGNVLINQPAAAVTNGLAVGAGTCFINGNLNFSGTTATTSYISSATVTTGSLSVTGSVSYDANTLAADQVISVTTGTINFTNSLTIPYGTLAVTSTGTINFNGTTEPSLNFGGANTPVFTTATGCTLNFADGFTNNNTLLTLAAASNSVFTGSASITPNGTTTFGNLLVNASLHDTLAAGSTVIIAGTYTISTGSAFVANQSFEVDGNWTNNGTFTTAADTVTMNGTAQVIAGSSSTAFPSLRIGRASSAVTVLSTMNVSCSCTNLILDGYNNSRTLTLGAGITFTVSGNVTINQPTAAVTNALNVNTSACNISGGITFSGTTATTSYISKVAVTTGTLTVAGTVNYAANTLAADQVITVSTGTLNFGSSLTVAYGTLSVTSTGTINFNGTGAPSFNFGSANSPVFTTTAGSKLNFLTGFTNNTNALVIAATSTVTFTGSGSITPNANTTFPIVNISANVNDTLVAGGGTVLMTGIFTLASGCTFVQNQNFEVDANWVNNGGTLNAAGGTTVTLNAAAISIGGTGTTTFPILQIGNAATASTEGITMSTSNSCTGLIFSSATKARTMTLATGTTLTVNGNLTINQPAAKCTNELAVNAATCLVTGNLTFTGTTATATWIGEVLVTSGSFTVNGTVTWMTTTLVATSVITASTGTLTFGSSLTMGSNSGTLSVTSTGTINFNGTTAPSLNFGGAATAPVFTTTNGCKLNFANGFTNNTNALTLAATSIATFTGHGSITPNANITFGNVVLNAADTLYSATGSMIVAGSTTLASGSALTLKENIIIDGNWINNGGTLNGGTNMVIMGGTAQTISGSPTTFPELRIGRPSTATTVVCTMNNNNSCTSLVMDGYTTARTFTFGSGDTLTVSGNDTINQPTAAVTNNQNVGPGVCLVSGNLVFVGTTNTTTWVGKVAVTTGTFNISGTVTWMANTAVATEVISVTTGTLTFGSSLTMGTGTGTLTVSGAAMVNFNGASAPSLNFGGAATAPVLTTTSGCTLKFKNGFTNNTTALTIANSSTVVFTGSGTVTPSAAITFGNVQINSGATLTLAGNISMTGNWTNNGGTFTPATYTVTLTAASPNTQTITKTGGETFYNLSASVAGATIVLASNVTVTNALTMGGANFNLNNDTLTLGNSAGASLTRTAGIAYGGTWKRWFPASAITSSSGSYYGLFPVGISSAYSPVAINSTSSPTTAGYVLATYIDATTITLVTYTDNEAAAIQVISNKLSTLSTSGLAGGTYSLTVSFTGFSNIGVTTDEKLETYTGGTMGSVGTSSATTGTVISPNVIRTGLSTAQLSNTWVVGTKNKTNTPLEQYYYSRKSGNWDDVTSGNSTWSYTAGGSGASCNCVPSTTGYAIISTGHTITFDATGSADYIDVSTGGALADNGSAALTVNRGLTLYGTGTFTNSSVWTVNTNMTFSSSSSPTGSGTITSNGNLTMPSGATYTQTSGTFNITGNASIMGTLAVGTATLNFNGSGSSLSGTGNITGTASSTINMSNSASVASGSKLTIGTSASPVTFGITGSTTMTNNGHVKIYGNLTGNVAGSTWTNAANSDLEVTGTLLTTGTLNASASPDTVKYCGNGSQTIKAPASSYYDLVMADSGTKTPGSNISVSDALIMQDTAILSMGTYAITGNGDLDMTGNGSLTLQRSTGGTYPELNGNFNLTGGSIILNQTAGTAIVNNGNYSTLTLMGSGTYDMSGIPYISGNFNVQGSATLINSIPLIVGGNFTYSSSGSTTMNDDITAAGFTLTSGTLNDGGNNTTITGSGGWNNNGCTFVSSGFTLFNGTTAQQIAGSQATTFNSLQLNNAAGLTLNLSPAAPTVISSALLLTSGKLYTTSQNILRILDNATSSSGSSSSYVEGPMVKVGNDNFVFPIGKSGNWRRVGISNIADSLTEVTAEYFHAAYDTVKPVTGKLYEVSGQEYWAVERAVTTDSLQLQLFWQNISQIKGWQCNNITIAHFKNSQWVEEPATAVSGSNCTYGGSGSLLTTGYVTSFSPFTFGGDGGSGALPIELLSFTANPVENTVLTNWTTAIEINNNYFTVERSSDAINFTGLTRIEGAGNSTTQKDYEWTDEEPLQGISYYRLKQTDFNGNYTYSDIVAVNLVPTVSGIKLYPNPAHNEVFLAIPNPNGKMQCNIYDINGRLILTRTFEGENGVSVLTPSIPIESIPPGMYLVAISDITGPIYREKLIVK